MESFATPYPVIFNDGDHELDKGVVGIHSCLTFKRFQSMVGQKTGLPSAQLSTVFVCKRTVSGAEKKQKLPINENTNFAIILSQHNPSKERDCFFMVSLKRSKKERKAPKKRIEAEAAEEEKKVLESPKSLGSAESAEREQGTSAQGKPVASEDLTDADAEVVLTAKAPIDISAQDVRRASDPVKVTSPNSASTPQSAWKTGSILQRLSSGELKASSADPLPQPAPTSGVRVQAVQPLMDGVPGSLPKAEKTGGMVSPTSVLEPGQLRLAVPNAFPPHAGLLYPGAEKGAFTLFGQDPRGVDLRILLEDAVTSNMRHVKWCKFCAFCRDRNMAVAPFHWCVDDQIVSGFKGPNPAGPIGARGMKHRVAAA